MFALMYSLGSHALQSIYAMLVICLRVRVSTVHMDLGGDVHGNWEFDQFCFCSCISTTDGNRGHLPLFKRGVCHGDVILISYF